jgi:hypothetical protein
VSPIGAPLSHRVPALPRLLCGVVALLMLSAAGPLVQRSSAGSGPPFGQAWMATRGTIGRMEASVGDATDRFFDISTSYGLGGGWGSSAASASWASAGAFRTDLAAGLIAPQVRVVMYDPEHWAATPPRERRDPVAAMRSFAEAARAAGYAVAITPHPNLVDVPGAACGRTEGESTEEAFLRCGIQGEAAAVSDVVEIQSQSLEQDAVAYRAFVQRAAVQAKASNPDVLVLSGLSTRFAMDPGVLFRAWISVRDIVNGHYLAIPEGIRPDVAAAFLTMVVHAAD